MDEVLAAAATQRETKRRPRPRRVARREGAADRRCSQVAHGERKLDYNHFLEALAQTSRRKFPECDPQTAFAHLLVEHVFGLAAEEGDARGAIARVLHDLGRPAAPPRVVGP